MAGGAVGPAEAAACFWFGDDVSLARGVTFMVLHWEERLLRTTVYVNSISAMRRPKPECSNKQNIALFNSSVARTTMTRHMNPTRMKWAMFGSEHLSGATAIERGDVLLSGSAWRNCLAACARNSGDASGGVVHALSMVPIPFDPKRRGGQKVGNPQPALKRAMFGPAPRSGAPAASPVAHGEASLGEAMRVSVLRLCRTCL